MVDLKKRIHVYNEKLYLDSAFICAHIKCDDKISITIPFQLQGGLCMQTLSYSTTPCLLTMNFTSRENAEALQNCIDNWNSASIKAFHDGTLCRRCRQFELKVVELKDGNVGWLLRSPGDTFEAMLHGANPKLTVIDQFSKGIENIEPLGHSFARSAATKATLTTQDQMANSVFEKRNCGSWVELGSLECWEAQTISGKTCYVRSPQQSTNKDVPVTKRIKKNNK